MKKQSNNKEYTLEMQKLFLQMMISNAELYTRVMNIMNSENFDKSLRPVAELFKEHTTKYSVLLLKSKEIIFPVKLFNHFLIYH